MKEILDVGDDLTVVCGDSTLTVKHVSKNKIETNFSNATVQDEEYKRLLDAQLCEQLKGE